MTLSCGVVSARVEPLSAMKSKHARKSHKHNNNNNSNNTARYYIKILFTTLLAYYHVGKSFRSRLQRVCIVIYYYYYIIET